MKYALRICSLLFIANGSHSIFKSKVHRNNIQFLYQIIKTKFFFDKDEDEKHANQFDEGSGEEDDFPNPGWMRNIIF